MPAKLRPHAAPATFVSLAVILALAVAGLMALSGGQAAAVQQVSCGDTITADATLHHNLVNCPNNGIVIGADDITLDLNYHRIDGDGTPAVGCDPETEFCDIGVLNLGHDGVTVMHGSVREFDAGAVIGEARHNRLLDISSSRNRFVGIAVFDSARSVVRGSSGSGALERHEGAGLGLFDSDHVRILRNSFRHSAHNGIVMADSKHNLIKGNVFSRNDDEGILMEGGERNQIRRNRFVRNGAGITLGPGSRNVITHNRVSRGRDGIRIEKGHRNLVAHNVVAHTHRAGIRLGIHRPFFGGAHNVIRGNLVRGSRVDGFVVVKKDDHSLLKRNIARGAGDDGFDIASRTTKLTRNKARHNRDLGIEAVRGVIDGGGNIARHNGDPRQCTHIVCR
jgi:parallel beta-helix repeat protein